MLKFEGFDVEVVEGKRWLKPTKNSSCLNIPPFFYDYKHFGSMAKFRHSSQENKPEDKLNQVSGYQLADKGFVTVIKKSAKLLEMIKVERAIKILESHKNYLGRKFIVSGKIVKILNKSFEKIIK